MFSCLVLLCSARFLLSAHPFNCSGAIGGIDSSSEMRADLAQKSRSFTCSTCGIDHATCSLAATPFTVSLALESPSPSLRSAGGAVKPATPSSKSIVIAPPSPKPADSPSLSSPPVIARSPAAAAGGEAAASPAAAAALHESSASVQPAQHADTTVTAAQPAPPAPRTNSRVTHNRAPFESSLQLTQFCNRLHPSGVASGVGIDLYVAAFSVSTMCPIYVFDSRVFVPLTHTPSHSIRYCP